jgi:hypothetical protein
MGEYLTTEEIEARFDSEWVLLDQPERDEQYQLLGGILVYHGKDRDEVYRKIDGIPLPRNIAVYYTGKDRLERLMYLRTPPAAPRERPAPIREEDRLRGYVSMEEIKDRFKSEWILLDQPSKNEFFEVVGGFLVCHSKDPDEVHEKAMALPIPRNIAVLYTGRVVPEGWEVVL